MRWRSLLVVLTSVACGEEPPPPAPGECTQAQELAAAVPGFCLYDANPSSATHDDAVSPRDFLESVSGWYFAAST